DWSKIRVLRNGDGDYWHQQGPVSRGEIVVSVGAAMPPCAFSSLCCPRPFHGTEPYRAFLDAYRRAREWVRSAPVAEVAAAEAEFFPGVSRDLLAETIARYQQLGTWDGDLPIPRDLYEQSLNVFAAARAITWRHPYDEVVIAP